MNQKVTFDLLRLAGLLGFCKDARNRHCGREVDSVFNTLASDVSSLLKNYQDTEDRNRMLKQELCSSFKNYENIEEQNRILRSGLHSNCRKYQDLENQNLILNEELRSSLRKYRDIEDQNRSLRQELHSSFINYEDIEEQNRILNEELRSNFGKYQTLENQNLILDEELRSNFRKNQDLENQNLILRDEIRFHLRNYQDLENQNQLLRQELRSSSRNFEDIEEDNRILKEELRSNIRKYQDLENQNLILNEELRSNLTKYEDIEDQNRLLRQELRSCNCRGARDGQSGQNNRPIKRKRNNVFSSSSNQRQSSNDSSSSGITGGAIGGAYGGSSGTSTATSSTSSSISGYIAVNQSSSQLSFPSDVVAMGQAEMRNAGFELLDQLGHGGFGVVYGGRSLYDPNEEVAIKFTLCSSIYSWRDVPNDNVQIPAEAAAIIALEDVTSVVDLFAYGRVQLGNDDVFFLIMEKPSSCLSFDEYLRRQVPMDETRAFFFLDQLASMVLAIHQCEWVHGDLKPSNILICGQDQLKVIDFGLAKNVVNGECIVTMAGGTPLWNYPPERLDGAYDLVKATVWSVGVIYFYMIFGRRPFSSLRKAKKRPLKWHFIVSSEVQTILRGLLDPDPRTRVAIRELEQFIRRNAPTNGIC